VAQQGVATLNILYFLLVAVPAISSFALCVDIVRRHRRLLSLTAEHGSASAPAKPSFPARLFEDWPFSPEALRDGLSLSTILWRVVLKGMAIVSLTATLLLLTSLLLSEKYRSLLSLALLPIGGAAYFKLTLATYAFWFRPTRSSLEKGMIAGAFFNSLIILGCCAGFIFGAWVVLDHHLWRMYGSVVFAGTFFLALQSIAIPAFRYRHVRLKRRTQTNIGELSSLDGNTVGWKTQLKRSATLTLAVVAYHRFADWRGLTVGSGLLVGLLADLLLGALISQSITYVEFRLVASQGSTDDFKRISPLLPRILGYACITVIGLLGVNVLSDQLAVSAAIAHPFARISTLTWLAIGTPVIVFFCGLLQFLQDSKANTILISVSSLVNAASSMTVYLTYKDPASLDFLIGGLGISLSVLLCLAVVMRSRRQSLQLVKKQPAEAAELRSQLSRLPFLIEETGAWSLIERANVERLILNGLLKRIRGEGKVFVCPTTRGLFLLSAP
jgi:hypothetical protein